MTPTHGGSDAPAAGAAGPPLPVDAGGSACEEGLASAAAAGEADTVSTRASSVGKVGRLAACWAIRIGSVS